MVYIAAYLIGGLVASFFITLQMAREHPTDKGDAAAVGFVFCLLIIGWPFWVFSSGIGRLLIRLAERK